MDTDAVQQQPITDKGVGCEATYDPAAGTVTLVYKGLATPKHKKDASPRTIPLGAIESVDYNPGKAFSNGYIRFVLRSRGGYDKNANEDANAYLIKGTKKSTAAFAEAVAAGLGSTVPDDDYGSEGNIGAVGPNFVQRMDASRERTAERAQQARDREQQIRDEIAARPPTERERRIQERLDRNNERFDAVQAKLDKRRRELLADRPYSVGSVKLRAGKLTVGTESLDVTGAKASVETGVAQSRMSATRVIGGAALIGPVGLVLGALSKKNTSRVFLTIEMPDGTLVLEDVPAKKESAARQLATAINNQARGG